MRFEVAAVAPSTLSGDGDRDSKSQMELKGTKKERALSTRFFLAENDVVAQRVGNQLQRNERSLSVRVLAARGGLFQKAVFVVLFAHVLRTVKAAIIGAIGLSIASVSFTLLAAEKVHFRGERK